jgi:hypothetical protein
MTDDLATCREAADALAHSAQSDGVIERSTALWLIAETRSLLSRYERMESENARLPKRMSVDWQTVRRVLLVTKPDWQPQTGNEETTDSRAYHFCQAILEAYRADLQVTCLHCRQLKDPYEFYRCWDCKAYLCEGCIKAHAPGHTAHPKLREQYETEIADLKSRYERMEKAIAEIRDVALQEGPLSQTTRRIDVIAKAALSPEEK